MTCCVCITSNQLSLIYLLQLTIDKQQLNSNLQTANNIYVCIVISYLLQKILITHRQYMCLESPKRPLNPHPHIHTEIERQAHTHADRQADTHTLTHIYEIIGKDLSPRTQERTFSINRVYHQINYRERFCYFLTSIIYIKKMRYA